MKRTLYVLCAMLAGTLVGCAKLGEETIGPKVGYEDSTSAGVQKPGVGTFGGTYADQQWWRSLTQSQRNVRIRQAAYNEYLARGGNGYLTATPWSGGYTCKTWIQLRVVPFASNGVAWIPTNNGSCAWNSGQYVRAAGVSVTGVTMGQIIQMKWGSTLHTAIVWDRNSSGMWWIDCNFNDPPDSRLRVHYVSFSTFNSKSGNCYTVYEVTGG